MTVHTEHQASHPSQLDFFNVKTADESSQPETTWQDTAHPAVIQLYKSGDLALNPAKEIAALPREMQEKVISEKGMAKILSALRKAKIEVKRTRLFETLHALEASVERSEAELDLEERVRTLWHEVKAHSYEADEIQNRHLAKLESNPQTIRGLEVRIKFLKLTMEKRRMWLKSSLKEAERLKVISEQEAERFSEEKKHLDKMFARSIVLARIFDRLEVPLQKKFLRDSLRHYHPDKYPADISEQERADREAICKVLIEINRDFKV